MHLDDTLKGLGLSESEIRVYVFLLEHGVSSPPEIAKALSISRSNLHHMLLGLIGKGLVRKQNRGKRFVYIPADPSVTLRMFDERRKVMEEAVTELNALYKKKKNKPVIKFYDGPKELEQIFDDVLEARGKEILGFTSLNRLFDALQDYDWLKWRKELKKRRVFLKDILSFSSKKAGEEVHAVAAPYQEFKLIDEQHGDIPTDILIWDDKVAVTVLDNPVFGMVIENQKLADSYRIQFSIMWKALPHS